MMTCKMLFQELQEVMTNVHELQFQHVCFTLGPSPSQMLRLIVWTLKKLVLLSSKSKYSELWVTFQTVYNVVR